MKSRLFLMLVALIAAITACAPPPELRNEGYLKDTSLIDGEPCGPPCWRGIKPGETTWQDARTILEDDPTLTDIQIQDEEDTEELGATFRRVDGIGCCLIYTEKGEIVDQMLFQLAPDITLEQVIEKYDAPAYVSLSEVSGDQAAAALYYPDISTIIYAFVAGIENGALREDSEIFATLYVRESDMEIVIKNSFLYDWEGYGTYKQYAEREYVITPLPTIDPSITVTPTPESTESSESSATPEPTATAGS